MLAFYVKKKKLGLVIVAPFDVYLDRKNAFQPDICFISNERKHFLKEDGLYGAPDLVIEILSPGTAKYDMGEKKNVYERSGVTELWLIDPADNSVKGYYLAGDEYQEIFNGKGSIESKLLDNMFEFE